MYPNRAKRVEAFSKRSLEWLENAPLTNIKEASQAARALCMWGDETNGSVKWLLHNRKIDHWKGNNQVRNTARACSALFNCGFLCSNSAKWLASMQLDNGSWNNDVYDTCYSLISLGQMGNKNRVGVKWLLDTFSENWKHPGTIALINSAMIHQYSEGLADTISRNSSWLLAQCTDGNWKHPATSCLVVQSLILDGRSDQVEESVDWLLDGLEEEEDTGWKVSVVALVLITLKML
ncbi:MAG TPA: hypothetical protein VMW20_06600 [Candidatus Nanoarchaeia archaeon]|nr:hypothetical protein [Candidatus Nanoarchaeia archaeon]